MMRNLSARLQRLERDRPREVDHCLCRPIPYFDVGPGEEEPEVEPCPDCGKLPSLVIFVHLPEGAGEEPE